MIAYLSGPIENANDGGENWRLDMTQWLNDRLNHRVFNPVIETKSVIEKYSSDFRLMKKHNPDEYKNIALSFIQEFKVPNLSGFITEARHGEFLSHAISKLNE